MATILVVDDIAENVQLLTFALEDDGYQVVPATTGAECLEKIAHCNPDLILLDIMMPVMNGMETLRQIKSDAERKQIPVIMVSANDEENQVISALDMGAHDFVAKPINYHILAARMRSALRLREAQQQLTQLNSELKRLASIDPLTGVYNRRSYYQQADAEFNKSLRHQRPLSVIMLDVDHFKNINDRYGHAMGDVALTQLARICVELIRSSDFVGRLGGEEFAICCPETDLEGAVQLAERLRATIGDTPVKNEDIEVSLTVSIGVSQLVGADASIDHLQNRADQLLYEAKQKGRNRVVSAMSVI